MTCPANACAGGGAAVVTGDEAAVVLGGTVVLRTVTATVNESPEVETWGDSGSGKYTNRKTTRLDATGTVDGMLDCEKAAPGNIYNLGKAGDKVVEIHTSLVIWERNFTGCFWAFPCSVITKFQVTYDMDTKKATRWSFDYGSDGTYYRPGESPSWPAGDHPNKS